MKAYYKHDGVRIYLGDCLEVMTFLGISDERFDMVFTSPPYNLQTVSGGNLGHYSADSGMNGRGGSGLWRASKKTAGLSSGYDTHDDNMDPTEYAEWQKEFLSMSWHMLTDVGAIFYNHKPRVLGTELWMPLELNPGLPLRQIVIWARGSGFNFSPTYYLPTHEWILIFAKEAWRLKERRFGDVWNVTPERGNDHPAPFPVGLPARAIESCGPRSILDPFMGSGTTLRAAMDAGIEAVGIDSSEAYCEMAAKRLEQGSFIFSAKVD